MQLAVLCCALLSTPVESGHLMPSEANPIVMLHTMWVPNVDSADSAVEGGAGHALREVAVTDKHHKPGPIGEAGQLHSQVGQDWLVASLLGCKHDGYFLDLAAHDKSLLSNSLMLERDFGWRGICVEANPEYQDGLLDRSCQYVQAVAGSHDGSKVEFAKRGKFGGIIGTSTDNHDAAGAATFTAHTVSLQSILKELKAPSVIDYFSLDVEGAESIVMENFPWESYKFNVLTVERPKSDLNEMLKKHGYKYLRTNSKFNDQTWVIQDLYDGLHAQWRNAGSEPHSCMTSSWPETLKN